MKHFGMLAYSRTDFSCLHVLPLSLHQLKPFVQPGVKELSENKYWHSELVRTNNAKLKAKSNYELLRNVSTFFHTDIYRFHLTLPIRSTGSTSYLTP